MDSATGDLNRDSLGDVALVLQYEDSISISTTDNPEDSVITQPRMLLILFKDDSTSDYIKKAQSNTFILNHDNPAMDYPYNDIKISNGSLQIDFTLFYNMGSWYITNSIYKFRFQNNLFIL
ncbi:hypothetical protein BH10BAC2_BH10BAC2_28990 [soil metagenome]